MNKKDIPIKYELGLHQEPELRTESSYLYDIINHLLKSKSEEFKFTTKTLKYVFGDKMNDETFKSDLVKAIKFMISAEEISVSGETLNVTKKGLSKFYDLNA